MTLSGPVRLFPHPPKRRAVLIAMLLLGSLASTSFAAADLFTAAPSPATPQPLPAYTVARQQSVYIDTTFIDTTAQDLLVLHMFDDVTLVAQPVRVERLPGGGFIWHGTLPDNPLSSVILCSHKGVLVGNIILPPDTFYAIRYAEGDIHVVQEVDPSSFPQEAEPTPVTYTQEELDRAAAQPMVDGAGTIDALVVYTPAARSGAGGTSAMEALIYLAAYETNQGYLNSGITQRLQLVHMAEVAYVESGSLQTDRNRLKDPADTFMDNVHTLRNTYCGDVVSLIVNSGDAAGIAYIMTAVSAAFESSAFCVVRRDCAAGNYSLGHEFGHIMSARHDWYVDATNNSPYTYNHGFVSAASRWRTVMAYNNRCSAAGFNCTRILHWSNPNVLVGSVATGVAAGTSTACTTGNLANPACDADNRLTLNNTAATVANFRQHCTGNNTVWMRDTWKDTGAEPNTTGGDMWKSPYIWIRLAPDAGFLHQHEHQNPEYGQTNYVYVKLHNGFTTTQTGTLRLYYANAATGLVWPTNWTQIGSGTGVSGFASGSTKVVEVPWSPPGTGHYCLLARWVSTADPMGFTETADVNYNTTRSNNILWRNMNIVNFIRGSQMTGFILRNTVTTPPYVSLGVEMPPEEEFLVGGGLLVDLDQLYTPWMQNGGQGYGFQVAGGTMLRIVEPGALIDRIPVNMIGQPVHVTFESDSARAGRFQVDFVQLSNADRVGGVSYEVIPRANQQVALGGRVSNMYDTPLAGIRARLHRLTGGSWPKVDSTLTDPLGNYSFEVFGGTYRVCFFDPAGAYVAQCYGNAPDVGTATDIVVGDEAVADIDAHLKKFCQPRDQYSPASWAGSVDAQGNVLAQSFAPVQDLFLDSVELYINSGTETDTMRVYVQSDATANPTTIFGQTTMAVQGAGFFNFALPNVSVVGGVTYYLRVLGGANWSYGTATPYPGGTGYMNGSPQTWDFGFRLCGMLDPNGVPPNAFRAVELRFTEIVPNPFTGSTTLRYFLPAAGEVKLEIYNAAGQVVRTLVRERQSSGLRVVTWDGHNDDGHDVAAGVYLAKLQSGDRNDARKVTIMK